MDYRALGRSGLKVSPLCIGNMNFGNPTDEAEAARIVAAAVDAGINFFDTADMYNGGESEAILGRIVAEHGRRDELIIATKAFMPTGDGPNHRGSSRLHILRACEHSLRRLKTDYIDLYQMHRPDPSTPIEETLSALTDLVRQGKVRYIGCSTHPAWQVMEALLTSELKHFERYISEQPPYNLLDRRIENELLPLCRKHGVGVIPWAPMAQGVLAGRYRDFEALPMDSRAVQRGGIYAERVTRRGIEVGRRFVELAEQHQIAPAQLALLWVKEQAGITAPIYGARSVEQLQQILPFLEHSLSDELRQACDELVPPGSAVVNFHNSAAWMKQVIG